MKDFVIDTSDNRMMYVKKELQGRGYSVYDYDKCTLTKGVIYIFSPAKLLKVEEIETLNEGSVLYAGNLDNLRAEILRSRNITHINLLSDEVYAYENAIYTAEVALMLIVRNTSMSIYDSKMLILGYGRVGKAMANLLSTLGVDFAIAARRYEERASAYLLTSDIRSIDGNFSNINVIINTIPARILDRESLKSIDSDCYILDLASYGMIDEDSKIGLRYALEHGLPGRYTPKSAGASMTRSILRTIGD